MCLTLGNAATIGHHTDPTGTAVRGYTSTTHHAGHLTPGDQWRPLPDQPPRTVTDIHRRHGVMVLTDQYGTTWTYPATSSIPTDDPTNCTSTPRPRRTAAPDDHHLRGALRSTNPRSLVTTPDHHPPPTRIPTDAPMIPPGPGGGVHSH